MSQGDEHRLDLGVVQCGSHVPLIRLLSFQITRRMTDHQRFKYYTGYEVDNEPSDDEGDECTASRAISQSQVTSER